MSTAQEPNPYGYAGEGTVPDPRPDDELEDTAESIAIPSDDLTAPFAEAAELEEDDDKK